MSGRGCRGQSRTSAPEAPLERYVEHTLRSEDASMNRPPTEPSRAADPGVGTLTMDQVIQIVTAATRQTRESSEDQRGMIERALKLGAKTYDGCGPTFFDARPHWIGETRFLMFVGKPFKKTVWSHHLFLFYFKRGKTK